VDWWAIGCVLFFCITGGRYLFDYKETIENQKVHTSGKLLEIHNGRNEVLNRMDPRCKCIFYYLTNIIQYKL